jgi:hypothetical protein
MESQTSGVQFAHTGLVKTQTIQTCPQCNSMHMSILNTYLNTLRTWVSGGTLFDSEPSKLLSRHGWSGAGKMKFRLMHSSKNTCNHILYIYIYIYIYTNMDIWYACTSLYTYTYITMYICILRYTLSKDATCRARHRAWWLHSYMHLSHSTTVSIGLLRSTEFW